jgi:glycosyltransferase involved in cell wall biosynthesis
MRVLQLHNRYRHRGGEDSVVTEERRMLQAHGVDVISYEIEQGEGEHSGRVAKLVDLTTSIVWSATHHERVRELCRREQPDVAHVHNFWMTMSPAVHSACHIEGVPTVQTLHNFRLSCTNALFLRDNHVCLDCLGKLPWRGVVRRCYRDSYVASAAVAAMATVHRIRGTWNSDVDAFIALSDHSRQKFVEGGLPADRLFVKPNALAVPPAPKYAPSESNVAVYAGRLSQEKGVHILLAAWAAADLGPNARLVIIGEGPEREALVRQAESLGLSDDRLEFAGVKSSQDTLAAIAGARVVVLPSICFENFPRLIVEAFSLGRPVIGSDLGATREIIRDGVFGLTFKPGDYQDCATHLRDLFMRGDLCDQFGRNARKEFLAKYTTETNIEQLIDIYRFAIEHKRAQAAPCEQEVQCR